MTLQFVSAGTTPRPKGRGLKPHDTIRLRFFQNYTPKGKNLFDIVIAYPVEYANWIEIKRGTTGIMRAYSWSEQVSVQYLKLVRK